ncbi:hypothetical protein EVAR_50706_1 [Eumeta japonica]|uniref:RNA-directed DNA polymerase from mobile element jockey n=1 Tax=Eumeta variegata TaxID=151549 RepID=A0A4C1YMJ9_EUMVA|nr:hypothetical protein EVAR_50706_1 [Eumeta japonica]
MAFSANAVSVLLSTKHYPPPHPIGARIPQGSCLSTRLYATYTDDISKLRNHLKDWEDDVMWALYDNDSVYFASSRRANLAARKIQQVFGWIGEGWLSMSVGRPLY